MKSLIVAAAATVAVSVLGFAGGAHAQTRLFFEGDLERGNQPGTPPACVLENRFKHKDKVVFRVRVRDQDGKELDDKAIKSMAVQLPDGTKIDSRFSGHPPRDSTDHFWTSAWIVPDNYPTGTFAYKVIATDLQGNTHTWEPFKVKTSQLTILEGAIEIK